MTILGALSHRTAAEWVPAWNLRVRGARPTVGNGGVLR